LLSAAFLLAACPMLLYAEIASGWTEALFLKVKQNARVSNSECMPNPDHDKQLVFVSCPIVYMHDFRVQAAGTFVENVAPGTDLRGLSMELRTEIYQWQEVKDCRGCGGRLTDKHGDCTGGSGICSYSFEKVWMPGAISTGSFHCTVEGQSQCHFPKGGAASIQNTGSVPDSMRSFKKAAERVSIGMNPGRYYLSEELIAQLPGQRTPLRFPNDALPTLPGKTTTVGRNNSDDNEAHEVRLETNPGSLEPDIGDVRSQLTMMDFFTGDPNRQVSIVAKQAPYINGEAHRTLVPWNSNLTSWKDDSPLIVDWLDAGISTFDEMVSEHRSHALDGVLITIVNLRIWGVTCILLGLCLLCGPLAKTWLSKREWTTGRQGIRDVLMLVTIALALSLTYALMVASLPWLHYWKFCGGLLMGGGLLTFTVAIGVLWLLDSRENLVEVLNEHKITFHRMLPPPATDPTESNRLTEEQGREGLHEHYGATSDASSAGMADVEEGAGDGLGESDEDNF